jgi:hypothetical protein
MKAFFAAALAVACIVGSTPGFAGGIGDGAAFSHDTAPQIDRALAGRTLALVPLQQHFACRHQFTATQRSDDGLVRLRKDTKRVRIPVSTLRLPLVHTPKTVPLKSVRVT